MRNAAAGALRARAGRSLLFALVVAGPADDAARAASLTVASGGSGPVVIDSASEPREIATVAFRQRSRTSACLAFATASAPAPSSGVQNSYQLGFVDTDRAELEIRQFLDFADNVGLNDAGRRQVSALHVDDGVPRGRHAISWAGTRNPDDEDLAIEDNNLAVVCAKREIPWRDEGVLPARVRAAVGGSTGPDAPVTHFAHYDELIDMRFTLQRPLHCVALASGVAFNPGGGLVDNAYELLLTGTNDAAGVPVQRIELDDNIGAQDTEFLPVSAVRFFPRLEAGEQQIRWLGIKDALDTAALTIGYPTLAVACTRDQLGLEPVSGRAAVGGAHLAGDVALTDDALHELVGLHFSLSRPARCAAFASAWATNPGGGTLDNGYHFGLQLVGTVPNALFLEFDDNAGHDDAGALPVAVSESWSVDRGEHEIRFLGAKDDAGDADVTVSSPSLAVVCAKPALEP